jgi:hypothetical protein
MTTSHHSNADFYTGLGRDAVWIGSLGAHATPTHLASETLPGGRALLTATTETDYRAAFNELARHWDDQYLGVVYRPLGEWPVTWVDSTLVGYRYALGDGRVSICGPDDAGRWWTTTGRHGPDDRPAALTEVHYYYGIQVGIPRDPDATAAYGCYRQHHIRAADAASQAVRTCFAREIDMGALTRPHLGELIADLGVPGVADHAAFPHHQERAMSALRALRTGMFYAVPGNNPQYATSLARQADSMARQALAAARVCPL